MQINFVEQHEGCCRVCGRPVEELKYDYLCSDCRVYKPHYDRAATALNFTSEARRLVLNFKYNGYLWLLEDFCDWLEGAACARYTLEDVDLLLSMPITLWHRMDRGYNPSALLAKRLAKRLKKPHYTSVLARKGHPKRQAGLNEEARRENVKDTFKVRNAALIQDKIVLLIDDVMTTGATLSEAAKTLKEAGACVVLTLTLARSFKT